VRLILKSITLPLPTRILFLARINTMRGTNQSTGPRRTNTILPMGSSTLILISDDFLVPTQDSYVFPRCPGRPQPPSPRFHNGIEIPSFILEVVINNNGSKSKVQSQSHAVPSCYQRFELLLSPHSSEILQ